MPKLKTAADVDITGMVITVDRMEKALDTERSAVQQAYIDFGVKVYSIVNMNDIIKAIKDGIVEGKEYLEKCWSIVRNTVQLNNFSVFKIKAVPPSASGGFAFKRLYCFGNYLQQY